MKLPEISVAEENEVLSTSMAGKRMTKGADIGAFLIGIKWGKHTLIPRISPKKTVEGAIGGICFGILGALVSKSFLPSFPIHLKQEPWSTYEASQQFSHLILHYGKPQALHRYCPHP